MSFGHCVLLDEVWLLFIARLLDQVWPLFIARLLGERILFGGFKRLR